MKVKVISLPYIFQLLYVLCFTRPRYQVSVYRTIGPLVLQKVELSIGENCYCWPLKRVWKKVASQGKVSEKSGNLDMDIEWQP